jgi:hypothetical protein
VRRADEAGGVDAEDGERVAVGVGVAVEHARGGDVEGLAGAQGVGVVVGDRGGVATLKVTLAVSSRPCRR